MKNLATNLLVVGGGPAGLAHAFWRRRSTPELDLRVIEQAPHVGGWIQTESIDGFSCELGPQGIRPDAASDAFVAALRLEDRVVPADPTAKKRFVARDGRLHPLPSGPPGLLKTDLFSLGGKLSLLLEPVRRQRSDDQESLAGFVGRRFGQQAVPLAEAMASGVFGGDAHALEMAAAFPGVKNLEAEHGSLIRGMIKRRKATKGQPRRPALHSFVGGMRTLINAASATLTEDLIVGTAVARLDRLPEGWRAELADGSTLECRGLVLAIPAHAAATLLREHDAILADELAAIPFASIANIYLGFPRAEVESELQGFGFLIDRSEQSPMLGAIYCSSILPQACDNDRFLVRVMAGGVLHPQTIDETDDTLIKAAEAMLRSYTGVRAPRVFGHVKRARRAIPQYVIGHSKRLRTIRDRVAQLPGLGLVGNSYDAVSVVGQVGPPAGPDASE